MGNALSKRRSDELLFVYCKDNECRDTIKIAVPNSRKNDEYDELKKFDGSCSGDGECFTIRKKDGIPFKLYVKKEGISYLSWY